ncbi:nucleotide-binding universal stress UspA family protein [Salana multivorans]|uniref:Nucleotide-binding universal stress UspA family protein n=1 Tax=Salana multivorans TaxID=120377 RepID=A0A3N2D1N0_9MICO|nr:universal stress protein [Salana multivorans]MBN8883321.1 universal stress protein [Salana multivorans]OJX94456.1 MAG: universal stress protein UspA [Micrococcales bacterium 73-15]ROR93685.1 nucleotide-binding universal stress UspA family protein [Salana multivorans]
MASTAIVVGYLATPEGEAALEAAAVEAGRRGARVVVVASRRPSEDSASHDAAVERVRDRLDESGLGYEVRQLDQGRDVAEDLIETAEESQAELIVIGLRRRSPVGKLILGSNAQRVLLDAPVPVLAVKSV